MDLEIRRMKRAALWGRASCHLHPWSHSRGATRFPACGRVVVAESLAWRTSQVLGLVCIHFFCVKCVDCQRALAFKIGFRPSCDGPASATGAVKFPASRHRHSEPHLMKTGNGYFAKPPISLASPSSGLWFVPMLFPPLDQPCYEHDNQVWVLLVLRAHVFPLSRCPV